MQCVWGFGVQDSQGVGCYVEVEGGSRGSRALVLVTAVMAMGQVGYSIQLRFQDLLCCGLRDSVLFGPRHEV